MAALDARAGAVVITDESRQDPRLAYRAGGLIVQMHHPGGSCVNYLVRPRNLSTSGMGFLHGAFCYSGTPCHLTLHDAQQKRRRLKGRVVRCQLIEGLIHEVGVQFDEPIEIEQFVGHRLNTGADTAPAKALPRVAGRVLIADSGLDDRELLRFQLESIGAEVTEARTAADAAELAGQEAFDLVICEMWPDERAHATWLIEKLARADRPVPVLVVTSDHDPAAAKRAADAGATAVLIKPYKLDDLLDRVTGHLRPGVDPDAEPLLSDQWSHLRMRPLILDYLGRLEEQVGELEQLSRQDAAGDELLRVTARLRSKAGGYGYPQLSELADRIHQAVGQQMPIDRIRREVSELTRLAAAACKVRHH